MRSNTVAVHIENWYSDGHESDHVVDMEGPESADDVTVDEWFADVVSTFTGDGHYTEVYKATGERIGSCYTATIVGAPPHLDELIGRSHEWVD